MCGIVGVLRYGALGDKDNRNSALYLATTLLELTENRGKDATGVAALFDDGNFFGQKMAVRSSDFVARFGGSDGDFDGLQAVLRDYDAASLRTIIGHCRKKSVGGAFDNVNNHPIKTGNIIGLHNGTLKNHDIIFDNLKCERDGTVDSEAIFRLLQYYTKNCKDPFTLEMLEEVTKRLEGSFSILAFNANNPSQLVSARDGRPAEYCLIKPLKMVLIASEEKIINAAIWEYNKLAWNHALPGFTKLKASDIETKMLTDDTIALFDLTREITPDSKITDLYDTHPVPKLMDRIWKTPIKTTNYGNNYQNRNNNRNNTASSTKTANDNKTDADKEEKKSATSDSTTSKTGTEDSNTKSKKEAVGLAWNSKLEQYVNAWGKRENETNVVLDTEKKQLMSLSDALKSATLDEKDSALEDDNDTITVAPEDITVLDDDDDGLDKKNAPVERYITGKTVPINTITPEEDETVQDEESVICSGDREAGLAAIRAGVAKGKSQASDDMKASKAAIEAAKTLEKYETAAEVATLCGTDETSLEKLPIVALTNRILKQHFAKIFTAGYLAKCDEVTKGNQPDRISKAQKHIRVLKSLTSIMDGIMYEDSKTRTLFKKWAEDSSLGEISSHTLKEIFNPGDLRSNKSLRNIVTTLDNITTK